MVQVKPDYSNYILIYDYLREDGVSFLRDSFKSNDRKTVPLVWFNKFDLIIGYAFLEHRDEGLMAHCVFRGEHNAVKAPMLNSNQYGLTFYTSGDADIQNGVIKSGNVTAVCVTPRELIPYYLDEVVK